MFHGLWLDQNDAGKQYCEIKQLDEAQLPDGDVTIDVA